MTGEMGEKQKLTSDALTVARWLPGSTPAHALDAEPELGIPATFDPRSWESHDHARFGVRDAERVLVERGHEEAYGKALAHAVLVDSPMIDRTPCGARDVWWRMSGEDAAAIAMAAPEVRVRAMAAVIRAIEATRGTPCPFTFREVQCGYSGPSASCDKSFERCRELGNAVRFGGSPIRRPT
jgi:hypothetical protein